MTAFRGTYADWKNIRTRGVVQIVFEVPLAESDAAYEILGGMPNPAKERWFGVAALKSPAEEAPSNVPSGSPPSTRPDGTKRDWRSVPYPQQAGIRVNEAAFEIYLRQEHPNEWHETGDTDACLKFICKIDSKRELATNHKAAALWHQIDSFYSAWLAKERVGA